jgi:guanine deaminase
MERELEQAMQAAIAKAREHMRAQFGGPFGAAIIYDNQVIAVGANSVLRDHDPSAHAEVNAIRLAGSVLGTHDLAGCTLYATGYPCPMCLSAIIWANIEFVYYGCDAQEAERIGFRDDFIYRFIEQGRSDTSVLTLRQLGQEEVLKLYEEYAATDSPRY